MTSTLDLPISYETINITINESMNDETHRYLHVGFMDASNVPGGYVIERATIGE